MIKAHFEGKKFIIDLSGIDRKYLGKKIIFKLMYGLEVIGDSESEQYIQEKRKTITYNGESELVLDLEKVKDGYRGNRIFIGYYLEVDFGTKFLLFKDSKEIDIKGREDAVYYATHLNTVSGKFRNFDDKVDFKEIIKSMGIFAKISIIFFMILGFGLIYFGLTSGEFGLTFFGFLALMINFLIYKFSGGDIINPYINIKDNQNKVSEIITGTFKKDLESVYIELFALNTEEAHFVHQDGTTSRYVDFDIEIGNVLLFEKEIKNIKSGDKLKDLLKNDGDLDFSKMYENLFPTVGVSSTRGLFTKLELRISNSKFRDANYRKRVYFERENFLKKIEKNNTEKFEKKQDKIKTENTNLNSDFFE